MRTIVRRSQTTINRQSQLMPLMMASLRFRQASTAAERTTSSQSQFLKRKPQRHKKQLRRNKLRNRQYNKMQCRRRSRTKKINQVTWTMKRREGSGSLPIIFTNIFWEERLRPLRRRGRKRLVLS